MQISEQAEFQKARDDYDTLYKVSDDVLYELCRRYRFHRNRGESNAKLWLIGRAYATGIERQIKKTKRDGKEIGAMDQLTEHVWKYRSKVDEIIGTLSLIGEPLNTEKLKSIVEAHGQLLRVIKEITPGHTPRSFVSKYLHFHNPAVPIYDMVADSELRKMKRRARCRELFPLTQMMDEEYRNFVFRFWELYESINLKEPGSVKSLQAIS